ncbi:MAG: division/cell wall cluster transcriptional repressor MraZ [Chloroflexota bacterium]
MFYGQYFCTLDDSNRIEIPSAYRDLLAGKAVVTQGFDRNILVLPVNVFEDLARLVTRLNMADPLARGLQRMLLANAEVCEVDQAGKLVLPENLKQFAGMDTSVVAAGQGKYFETWSMEAWQVQEIMIHDADSNASRFISLDLAGL